MAILIWMASPSVRGSVNEELPAFPLAAYEARYTIRWHGIDAGESVHRLRDRGDGVYYFEARTSPNLSFIPYRYIESSNFTWESGKIVPQNYYYNITEGKKHKEGNVFFDWKANKLGNRKSRDFRNVTIPLDIQDKITQTLSLRHALKMGQANLLYTVAEDDKIKNYAFTILGEERLKTKLGILETVKVEHVSRKGHRTTTWLAKKWDYLPVKMAQFRQGKVLASGEILSFTAVKQQ